MGVGVSNPQKILLTVINYSGGKPSRMLVERVLRREVPEPPYCVVMNADPGAEDNRTYALNKELEIRCWERGIPYFKVPGPNLYQDLVSLTVKSKRVDNPPYWVVKPDGRIGRLFQKCTSFYKVAPMDREVRRLLWDFHGIPINRKRFDGIVEKWIGFTYNEKDRSSEPNQKYVRFRYPFIEEKITIDDVVKWFNDRNIPLNPRSVCNFCFSNGLEYYREMYETRPDEWRKAVLVDEAVRHGLEGVTGTVYVSRTCLPLQTLAQQGFRLSPDQVEALRNKMQPDEETFFPTKASKEVETDQDEYSCDSGACFL